MDTLTRRKALGVVVTGAVAVAGSVVTATAQDANVATYDFDKAELSKSCRLLGRTIDGTKALSQVVPGIVNNTYILVVSGKKPFLNMSVSLRALTYTRQPDYWGIEVLGYITGIRLPAIGTYHEFLPLDSIRGTKGIEVIWSGGETEKIDVPPKK